LLNVVLARCLYFGRGVSLPKDGKNIAKQAKTGIEGFNNLYNAAAGRSRQFARCIIMAPNQSNTLPTVAPINC
jgi:hypothetical protein